MKRLSSYLAFGIVLFGIVVIIISNKNVYSKVYEVDDKDLVFANIQDTFPKGMSFVHPVFGKKQVNDEAAMIGVMEWIEPHLTKTIVEAENKTVEYGIDLVFSNHRKLSIELSRGVELNGHSIVGSKVEQTQLKSILLSYLETPDALSSFLDKSKIEIKNGAVKRQLNPIERQNISKQLKQASITQVSSEQLKERPVSLLIVGADVGLSRDRQLNIVVYSTYSVIRYLGDDQGTQLVIDCALFRNMGEIK